MTEKKPRRRTLKSGEKVVTVDGVRQIVPTGTLAETLAATDNAMREADAAKTAARLAAVEAKRESLASGDAVPSDKRVV